MAYLFGYWYLEVEIMGEIGLTYSLEDWNLGFRLICKVGLTYLIVDWDLGFRIMCKIGELVPCEITFCWILPIMFIYNKAY